MAGATYVLDKTYKVTNAGGVTQYRAVVPGSNDGECKLPTAANQLAWGITQEAQSNQNENVGVRKYGISRAYAAETIAKATTWKLRTHRRAAGRRPHDGSGVRDAPQHCGRCGELRHRRRGFLCISLARPRGGAGQLN